MTTIADLAADFRTQFPTLDDAAIAALVAQVLAGGTSRRAAPTVTDHLVTVRAMYRERERGRLRAPVGADGQVPVSKTTTYRTYDTHWRRFAEQFGDRHLDTIVASELVTFITSVGGIATLSARLAEATNTTTALTHPDTPRSLPGVRTPWFLPQVRTRLVREALPLAAINTVEVEALGQQFADDNAPTLTRKALQAHRDDAGQVVVAITDATAEAPVAAAQMRLPLGDIANDLTARLVRSNAVAQTVSEANAAAGIAAAFLTGAGVDDDTAWRVEHSRLATGALVEWLATRQRNAPLTTVTEVSLTRWPESQPRIWPTTPNNRNRVASARNFKRGHPYKGWAKSLYPTEAFDSWSAEFRLAELLESAHQVKGWARIATDVPLTIAYTLGAAERTYRPDFIIFDDAGTYWVAEGKANSEMTDETVIAKRGAATRWVDAVNGSDAVPQRWAYLLASETAIANASGWPQLLAASFTHR